MSSQRTAFAQTKADLENSPDTLKSAVDAFLVLHANRLSPEYRQWLERRLFTLVDFLGSDLLLDRITIWQLDLWYAHLAERNVRYENHPNREPIQGGLAPATLHNHVKAIKTFFNWLGKRRLIQANPADLLDLPPVPEQPPKHAHADEVRALLKHLSKQHDKRNYCAVRLLQATGLRSSGLINLRKRDVEPQSRLLTVSEKGRGGGQKGRTVPMDARTAKALAKYMKTHDGRFAFKHQRGREKWTRGGLYQMLRSASLKILDRVVSPHMLRHFFGFEAIRRGIPMRVVQQIMGHSNSKTTEIYTRFRPFELRNSYDAAYHNGTDIEDA